MDDGNDEVKRPKGPELDRAAAEADDMLDIVGGIVDSDPDEYFRLLQESKRELAPLRDELREKKETLNSIRAEMKTVSVTLDKLVQKAADMNEDIESGRIFNDENALLGVLKEGLENYDRQTHTLNSVIHEAGMMTRAGSSDEQPNVFTTPNIFTEDDLKTKGMTGRLERLQKHYVKVSGLIDERLIAPIRQFLDSYANGEEQIAKLNRHRRRVNPDSFKVYSSDTQSSFESIRNDLTNQKQRLFHLRGNLADLSEIIVPEFIEFLAENQPLYFAAVEKRAGAEQEYRDVKAEIGKKESELDLLETQETGIIGELDDLQRMTKEIYTGYQERLQQSAPVHMLRMAGFVPAEYAPALPEGHYDDSHALPAPEEPEAVYNGSAAPDDAALPEVYDTAEDDSIIDAEFSEFPARDEEQETAGIEALIAAEPEPVPEHFEEPAEEPEQIPAPATYEAPAAEPEQMPAPATYEAPAAEPEQIPAPATYETPAAEPEQIPAPATYEAPAAEPETDIHSHPLDALAEESMDNAEADAAAARLYSELDNHFAEHDEVFVSGPYVVTMKETDEVSFSDIADAVYFWELKTVFREELDMDEVMKLPEDMIDHLLSFSMVPPPAIKEVKDERVTQEPVVYEIPDAALRTRAPDVIDMFGDLDEQPRRVDTPPDFIVEEARTRTPSLGFPPTDPNGTAAYAYAEHMRTGKGPFSAVDAMLATTPEGREHLAKKAARILSEEDTAAPFPVPDEVRQSIQPGSFGEPRHTKQITRDPLKEIKNRVMKQCKDESSIENYVWSVSDSTARARPVIYTVEEDQERKTHAISQRLLTLMHEKLKPENVPSQEELVSTLCGKEFSGSSDDIYIFSPGKYFLTSLCFIQLSKKAQDPSSVKTGGKMKLLTADSKFALDEFVRINSLGDIGYYNKLDEIAPYLAYSLILNMTEAVFNDYNIITEAVVSENLSRSREMMPFAYDSPDLSEDARQLLNFRKMLNSAVLTPMVTGDSELEEAYKRKKVIIGNSNIGNMYDVFTTLAGKNLTYAAFTEINSGIRLKPLKEEDVDEEFLKDLESCIETAWINYYSNPENKFKRERDALLEGGVKVVLKRIANEILDIYRNR